jgi:serine/threonine protein kinase
MIGQTILNYKIESLIGEGGMGSVYLATHTQMNRKVAIKALLPQFMANAEVKQRFKNEASTLAHLQHPNIVGLFDYIEDETGMYLVMEYVEGTPLDDFISNVTGPMPEGRAVPIMKEILSGFSYAHQKGIVHRDIKPANIIITSNDGAKILDFGIARLIGEGNHNLTKTGTQMGTVFYMSPEQVQGKKVDQRSDIYSLGVSFYQMLTGVNPYNGLTTEYEVYSRIVKEDLPSPQEVYPGVPDYLASVLKKAMEKNPDDRFQTCEDFLSAITSKVSIPKIIQTNPVVPPSDNTIIQPEGGEKKSNGAAVASLILGIVGIITSIIPFANFVSIIICLLAIIFGGKGISNSRKNISLKSSKGLAIAGLVTGIIGFLVALITSISLIYFTYFIDSDGDGVVDRIDSCIYDRGYAYNSGCPDSDSDGITDDIDECLYEKGHIDNNGCPWPDSDEDGVSDNEDDCPDTPGDANNRGCPSDSDGDGVSDPDDVCPDQAGEIENNGCPYKAKCPNCQTITNENTVNRSVNCNNCGTTYYLCKYKSNDYYGIRDTWLNDGECDCNGCEDEN